MVDVPLGKSTITSHKPSYSLGWATLQARLPHPVLAFQKRKAVGQRQAAALGSGARHLAVRTGDSWALLVVPPFRIAKETIGGFRSKPWYRAVNPKIAGIYGCSSH